MRRLLSVRPSLWVAGLALLALQGCAVAPPEAERRLPRPPRPAARPAAALPDVRAAIVSKVDRKAVQESFRFRRITFEVGEGKRVYAFMELRRLTPRRTYVAKAYWHTPDGRVIGPTVERVTPTQPTWYVWFWLGLGPRYGRATGSWRVRLELDGRLLATRFFRVVGAAGPARAVTARIVTVPHVDRNRVQDAFQNTTGRFEVGEGKRAYALMELRRLTPRRTYVAKAYWHTPDGRVIGPTVKRVTPTQPTWYVWFWLGLSPRDGRATGSWRVRLELDDRLLATRLFRVVGPRAPERAFPPAASVRRPPPAGPEEEFPSE